MTRWERLRTIERIAPRLMLDARTEGRDLSLREAKRLAAVQVREDESRSKCIAADPETAPIDWKRFGEFIDSGESLSAFFPSAPSGPHVLPLDKETLAQLDKLEKMNRDWLAGKHDQPRAPAEPVLAKPTNVDTADTITTTPAPPKALPIISGDCDPCIVVTRGTSDTKWINGEIGNPGTYGR